MVFCAIIIKRRGVEDIFASRTPFGGTARAQKNPKVKGEVFKNFLIYQKNFEVPFTLG